MKYIVTWCPSGAGVEMLTVIDGDQALTIDEIMERVCAREEADPELGYRIYSIVHADNVEVIY